MFETNCDCCKKLIQCEEGENGGLIENEDFQLWGDFALCRKCDEKIMKMYKEDMKRLEKND
jgi:hypothetical protein